MILDSSAQLSSARSRALRASTWCSRPTSAGRLGAAREWLARAPEADVHHALADELLTFCRDRLAHYKCPRRIVFAEALPRLDSGKIQRARVRDLYAEA